MASYTLPNNPKLKGLRPMTGKDVSTVLSLLYKYQERFDIVQLLPKKNLNIGCWVMMKIQILMWLKVM